MAITKPDMTLYRKLAKMDGHQAAELIGCGYHGDADPIIYGGVFYDATDWLRYGFATAVEFEAHESEEILTVRRGWIHRRCEREREDMRVASGLLAYDAWDELRDTIANFGMEFDGDGFPISMTYKLADWRRYRIWKSVYPWLASLSSR